MKNVEAIIPHLTILDVVDHLRDLHIDDLTVEPVNVLRKGAGRTLVFRGCEYKNDFVSETKIRFQVSDEDATEAETIVANAGH